MCRVIVRCVESIAKAIHAGCQLLRLSSIVATFGWSVSWRLIPAKKDTELAIQTWNISMNSIDGRVYGHVHDDVFRDRVCWRAIYVKYFLTLLFCLLVISFVSGLGVRVGHGLCEWGNCTYATDSDFKLTLEKKVHEWRIAEAPQVICWPMEMEGESTSNTPPLDSASSNSSAIDVNKHVHVCALAQISTNKLRKYVERPREREVNR